MSQNGLFDLFLAVKLVRVERSWSLTPSTLVIQSPFGENC